MTRVIVLSEINCLDYLKFIGITPDEFYTDYNLFKKKAFTFRDATVICIFAGTCRFSKRVVLETMTAIEKRSVEDSLRVLILSDTLLPQCPDYFVYSNSVGTCIEYSGTKAISKQKNLKGEIGYKPAYILTDIFLDGNDLGLNYKALEKVREKVEYEEQLRKQIKVPKLV